MGFSFSSENRTDVKHIYAALLYRVLISYQKEFQRQFGLALYYFRHSRHFRRPHNYPSLL